LYVATCSRSIHHWAGGDVFTVRTLVDSVPNVTVIDKL
jgi:hypothetical protein